MNTPCIFPQGFRIFSRAQSSRSKYTQEFSLSRLPSASLPPASCWLSWCSGLIPRPAGSPLTWILLCCDCQTTFMSPTPIGGSFEEETENPFCLGHVSDTILTCFSSLYPLGSLFTVFTMEFLKDTQNYIKKPLHTEHKRPTFINVRSSQRTPASNYPLHRQPAKILIFQIF